MKSRQEQIDQAPVVSVEINALSSAGSPRISGADPEHVEVLAAVRAELPPIIVHRPTMAVIDGLHRVEAARLRGETTIAVRFFDGAEADAFVMAVRSNIAHGLPLSLADRKRAAERIVVSHPQWSDRMVASVTGTAPGTVAEIRKRAVAEPASVRIGQDGRVRPLNGAEGRRQASELIKRNPELSLRQIARAAGISPETARDVRNRIRRGEDPLLKGRGAPAVRLAGQRAARVAAAERAPVLDQAAVVERLRSDPALRFSETGRNLLMLLNLHTVKSADWEAIINSVPPHCGAIVARLARDCSQRWSDFAVRVEGRLPDVV